MPLTQEQSNSLREEVADALNDYTESKTAWELAQTLGEQIVSGEISDPAFLSEIQKSIIWLKWIACPITRDDREFFELVKNNLLEGLELDRLSEIVTTRLSFQFGFNLEETLRGLILAIRENAQQIGSNPLLVKNETRPVRSVVRNWLIDFLRNTASANPAEVEEADYLFSNPNAKALKEADRQTLGKVLAFYDTFRSMARELAQTARAQMLAELPPEKTTPASPAPPQFYVPPTEPTALPPASAPPPPQFPPTPPPVEPAAKREPDTYREPVSEEDMSGPQKPPAKPAPRIEGNIIDLKDFGEK